MWVEVCYSAALWMSVILLLVYCFFYHKHFDIHLTMVFVLVPISNFGQLMLARSTNLREALVANRVVYVACCYLILMLTLLVFELCDIQLKRFVKMIMYFISTGVLTCALQMGRNDLYYKTVDFTRVSGTATLIKEYGPLHFLYYAMIFAFFAMGLGAITYSFFKKTQISRSFIVLLALPEALSIMSFFVGRSLGKVVPMLENLELVPFAFDLSLVVYLIIVHRLALYDISETVVDSVVQKGDIGFISFDLKSRYLGSNETAKEVFPGLRGLTVDKPISSSAGMDDTVLKWLYDFEHNSFINKVSYEKDDRIYLVRIDFLFDGRRERGYQMYITDDTKNQQYIDLIDSYNSELMAEVERKTAHVMEMQDNMLLAMAMVVESRDNSTGDHIKRTTEVVRILADEIEAYGQFDVSETFFANLIKAAPMHDLGKIAVDDAVLSKPGKYTAEEFENMKKHSAEGARIVRQILMTSDDEEFRIIAENVAHFHHERWDGSGYPLGLCGEQIPFEARIMAIADVFDGLVSRRGYKDSMTFEQANDIMLFGMGTHFDPELEPYYRAAFPRLEEYYRSVPGEMND